MLKTLRDRDQGPQPPGAEDILRASNNNS
jgi:hypothetical protein